MLFNSLQFLIFFPIVTVLYFLLPHKCRWFLLLVSSCIFYMAFIPIYILILAATILIDYFAGIFIENAEGKNKKRYLLMSILSTCAVLFIFKYFNFFNNNIASLAKLIHWNYPIGGLSLLLPIGLSFHTFQSLSYVIEVYRGHQKAEHNFGIYALYVMFYPQLVAGPIERPQNLLHQFYEKHSFNYIDITNGLKLMAWGFFKKVVIADRLAILVNQVYNHSSNYEGLPLIIATVFFAFQIFCDFSGYSDIAIGAAQVMGFKLMKNFDRPYFSKSISQFWKRWHISLTTWFKDYLYISMGGNRVSKWRWNFNLFFTFLVSGLWHGASWTFVIWGALNGFYLVFSIWTKSLRDSVVRFTGLCKLPRLHKYVQVVITFALISFAWIFFRANHLSDAVYIITHLFSGLGNITDIKAVLNLLFTLGLNQYEFIIAVVSIAVMEFVHITQKRGSIRDLISRQPLILRWTVYYLLVMSILVFGVFGSHEFIYFQF